MAPKRPKNTEPSTAPPPKRRQTRSSTKAERDDVIEKDQDTEISNADLHKPTPRKPKSKASKPKAAAPKIPNVDDITTLNSSAAITTLSLNHEDLKKPIHCEKHAAAYTAKTRAPTMVFTHGAGGTLSAPAVVNFIKGYTATNPVLAFQGSPNLAARTRGFYACYSHLSNPEEDVADATRSMKLIFGGRSMGARAACMAATGLLRKVEQTKEEENAAGDISHVDLVLVSYPLKGPKDIRDAELLDLPSTVRVLFIVGGRDKMCPIDLLQSVRAKMKATSEFTVVEGVDHGMHGGEGETEIGEEVGRIAARWVNGDV